jgi:hypothetical protein
MGLKLFCQQAGRTRSQGAASFSITLSSVDDYGNVLNPGTGPFSFSFTTQDEAIGSVYYGHDGEVFEYGDPVAVPYEAPQAAQARESQAAAARATPQSSPAQPGAGAGQTDTQ